MKRRWFAVLGVVVLAAMVGLVLILRPVVQFGPVATTCWKDAEIPAVDQQAVENAALGFVGDVQGASSASAYSALSTAARATVTAQQFTQAVEQLRLTSPTSPPVVGLTYLVEGMVSSPMKVPCGDIGGQHGPDFVLVTPASKQAHVLVTQAMGKNERIIEVWLVSEGGAWRIEGFQAQIGKFGGRDGETLWSEAKAQRAAGHTFNAWFLYHLAAQAFDRGPYFQAAVGNDFDKDAAALAAPAEPVEKFPAVWRLGDKTFDIIDASVTGTNDGMLGLIIDQPSPAWKGEADAVRRDHALMDAFLAAHPEWDEAFDFIAVRAATPRQGMYFGSTYTKGKGYSPDKPRN